MCLCFQIRSLARSLSLSLSLRVFCRSFCFVAAEGFISIFSQGLGFLSYPEKFDNKRDCHFSLLFCISLDGVATEGFAPSRAAVVSQSKIKGKQQGEESVSLDFSKES
jgi:hypothetical protein